MFVNKLRRFRFKKINDFLKTLKNDEHKMEKKG